MNTQGVPLGIPPPRRFVLRANPKFLIVVLCIVASIAARNPGVGIGIALMFWVFGWPYQEEMVVARVEY
jgi:hypothetical protein